MGMGKKKIVVAPFDSQERRYEADYICDGIDDQVEIQAALDLAAQLKTKVRFLKGTYNISGGIILPDDN